MVYSRGKPLFRSRVDRWRKCPANIARRDPNIRGAQLREGPRDISCGEPSALPVRNGLVGPQAIKIDRDIHVRSTQFSGEVLEMVTPIRAQDRAAASLVGTRTIIRPRVYIEPSRTLRAPIPEKLVRPPALEIPAAPDADFSYVGKFERPVDPSAAGPTRRAQIPVRMIVEGNEHAGVNQPSSPECG